MNNAAKNLKDYEYLNMEYHGELKVRQTHLISQSLRKEVFNGTG